MYDTTPDTILETKCRYSAYKLSGKENIVRKPAGLEFTIMTRQLILASAVGYTLWPNSLLTIYYLGTHVLVQPCDVKKG